MTVLEFDSKWRKRLEPSHYGLTIGSGDIVKLIDSYFERWSKSYPDFTYSQIKLKFGYPRIYCENIPSNEINDLEGKILSILNDIKNDPSKNNKEEIYSKKNIKS
jgi:hypothetical protein